jgi:Fe-S cluster assembly ATP-binding protein
VPYWHIEHYKIYSRNMKLELKDIAVSVDGNDVVHDVSLTLESGAVSVLMGKNGSGKSSLANAVMGHPSYKLTSGQILLNGEEITSLPPEKKAQKGLFLSQQHTPKIGGVTLATFLQKAYESVHCREVPALEFYLEQQKLAESLGLDPTLLDKPITESLSGGQKKQSEALQLAVLEPTFAFLDEIDSGVDVSALGVVFSVIRSLQEKGTGFLMVSHHPSLLSHIEPDHVYVMENGQIAKDGGPELAQQVQKNGF